MPGRVDHSGGRVGAAHPSRVGTFVTRVVLPSELPAAYAELVERVARSRPVHGTLTNSAQVLVSIETPDAVAA